ncbi:MAG: M13 family metallopeptidase [Flavobacteriales bacterium]
MKHLLQTLFFLAITQLSISQNIVQNNLSHTISPKDDFYLFVNEKWINETKIPIGKSKWGAIDELYVKTGEQIVDLLNNKNFENYPVNSSESALLKLFKSGMDSINIQKSGIKELNTITNPIYNIKNKENIPNVLNRFFKYNINGFVGVEVHPDITNTSKKALYIMPGSLGLPNKSFYADDKKEIQEKYVAYLNMLFQLAGEQKLLVDDAFSVEKTLVNGMLSEAEKRDPQKAFSKKTFEQLNENYNWTSTLDLDEATFSNNIIVMDAGYLKAWENVLHNFDINQIKAYLLASALRHAAPLLGDKWMDADFNFYQKTLQGKTERSSQYEKTMGVCNNFFGETIGKLYVETNFSESSKKKIEAMVSNIKISFENRIKNLDWMSNETKGKAIDKLQKMKVKIGYPDVWTNFGKLPELSISGADFYTNYLKLSSWKTGYTLAHITKEGQGAWFMNPQDVGAGSSPILNEIVFPAGTLQPPFYDPNADDVANYGAIGVVIGHEISHGFDDIGSQFDANGNMMDWWLPEEKKHFDALKKAVIDHYEAYEPLPGRKINGMVTLGENIADIAGVAVAFDAMVHIVAPEMVDGLTNFQRFFISYATLCREKHYETSLENELQTNPHCPGKYRLLGAISNLPEFYKAFEIGAEDAMFTTVKKRITVW